MAAVSNAFTVLNDFFEPADKAYTNGVSSMNLITEYDQHFSTWEFNPTANVNSVTDMESITLGLLVNQLGLRQSAPILFCDPRCNRVTRRQVTRAPSR